MRRSLAAGRRAGYPWPMNTPEPAARPSARPAALGWRLLALVYDSLPVLALLMLTSVVFFWLHGQRTVDDDPRWQWLMLTTLWTIVGFYFVLSWRRGGQTMGMRPWRLQVLTAHGQLASSGQLWRRYLVASLTPGLCLLWCLIDGERRGLHDLASGTVFVRRQA